MLVSTDVPPSTLRWVLTAAEADEVLSTRTLSGGWTSAMHAIVVRAGEVARTVVLRRMFREPWRTHARELLRREADVLTMLSGGTVPVATPIAVDERAGATDHPALLMTHLPGRLRLDAPATSAALASMLVRIHQVRPTGRPRVYQSWAVPERRVIPTWAERPEVWERAFSAIAVGAPAYRGCFLHRDFHPGNVLFDDDTISGVVDWVETSWGPPDLDVAHCSTALALLHGPAAVERFHAHYREAGGTLGGEPYWALIDAVGYLPDPEKVAAPWRSAGRPDLSATLARRRLETHVARTLGLSCRRATG